MMRRSRISDVISDIMLVFMGAGLTATIVIVLLTLSGQLWDAATVLLWSLACAAIGVASARIYEYVRGKRSGR